MVTNGKVHSAIRRAVELVASREGMLWYLLLCSTILGSPGQQAFYFEDRSQEPNVHQYHINRKGAMVVAVQ